MPAALIWGKFRRRLDATRVTAYARVGTIQLKVEYSIFDSRYSDGESNYSSVLYSIRLRQLEHSHTPNSSEYGLTDPTYYLPMSILFHAGNFGMNSNGPC